MNRMLPAFLLLAMITPAFGGDATHWAFVPPKKVEPPAVKEWGWVRNIIDAFVLARLEAEGLSHAPEADRPTLLRRLSFDLIGLPPSPEEIATFEADRSPDAYENQVDRLLASPHFGERQAQHWLDLGPATPTPTASSSTRPGHPTPGAYRDWVVEGVQRRRAL